MPAIHRQVLSDRIAASGLTSVQIAARCRVGAGQVRDICTGHQRPSIELVHRLAAVLGTEPAVLLADPSVLDRANPLRRRRWQTGLKVSEAAERAGVSPPHLKNVERDEKNASGELLARLARLYGCEPSDLTDTDVAA